MLVAMIRQAVVTSSALCVTQQSLPLRPLSRPISIDAKIHEQNKVKGSPTVRWLESVKAGQVVPPNVTRIESSRASGA